MAYALHAKSVPQTATVEGASLYVAYDYHIRVSYLHFICHFDLNGSASVFENVSKCDTHEKVSFLVCTKKVELTL